MNKEALIETAEFIKKYGDKHFDISKWLSIDSQYLMDSKRIKITDYSKVSLGYHEMPYRDVYDLDNSFEEIVQNSEEYSEIFNSSSVYDKVAVEQIYESLCVLPFKLLKESDISNCNTTACIAGWAVLANNNMIIDNSFNETIVNGISEAGELILDLDDYETQNLFQCKKHTVWDLVSKKYNLEDKAWQLAKDNNGLYGKDAYGNGFTQKNWDELSEATQEIFYFKALGSLINSTIAYEVLMDIANNKINISDIYAEYSKTYLVSKAHTQS